MEVQPPTSYVSLPGGGPPLNPDPPGPRLDPNWSEDAIAQRVTFNCKQLVTVIFCKRYGPSLSDSVDYRVGSKHPSGKVFFPQENERGFFLSHRGLFFFEYLGSFHEFSRVHRII